MTGPALWFGLAIAVALGGALGLFVHVYFTILASMAVSALVGLVSLQLGVLTAFRDAGMAGWLVQLGFLFAIALQAWGPGESSLIVASRGPDGGRARSRR